MSGKVSDRVKRITQARSKPKSKNWYDKLSKEDKGEIDQIVSVLIESEVDTPMMPIATDVVKEFDLDVDARTVQRTLTAMVNDAKGE